MNARNLPKESCPPRTIFHRSSDLLAASIRFGCVIGTSLFLASCTAEEMEAFNRGIAQANTGTQNGYASGTYYNNGYNSYNSGYNSGTYYNSGYNTSGYNNSTYNPYGGVAPLIWNSRGEAYEYNTSTGQRERAPAYD